jgi:DNA-directed RNA polymerase specialized sigma24 family protein
VRNGPEQVQERQLIDEVLRGEPVAQRAFYDAHVGRISGLAYRMTGNETSARDCTQLVFIRVCEARLVPRRPQQRRSP